MATGTTRPTATTTSWTPHVGAAGGTLCIHDVFPNPDDGGRPPYEIYLRALDDGFTERRAVGARAVRLVLRVLTAAETAI